MKAATMARLEALKARQDLSAKVRARCDSLLDKLRAPVRIGIFGLPGTGKRRLLNALNGAEIITPALDLPTLELGYGRGASTEAMLPDGSSLAFVGLPSVDILRQEPVFLRVTAPVPALAGRRYLLVIADDNAGDLGAALGWAATRTDLALWCTRNWNRTEQEVWQAAPDALRNHALLVFTKVPAADGFDVQDWGFDSAFDIAFRSRAETDFAAERLSAHLASVIEEAVTQDVLAAHLFLQRHAPHLQRDVASTVRPAFPPPEAVQAAQPDDATGKELARLFQSLRRAAEDMRQDLLHGRLDLADPEAGLTVFEEIFQHLNDQVNAAPHLEETCPDLVATVADARDLSLLLRLEGGADQLNDAARLLLQLRQDIETRLAA